MRYAALIEYDGSEFNGWQRQPHAPSVQEAVERAISTVANHEIGTQCAGRTDTGVHATGQVIHFETNAQRDLRSWLLGINSNLPATVAVKKIIPVDDQFHARFSAITRSYRYIINNDEMRSALLANRATWEFAPLREDQMRVAASFLLGRHDFSSYRALACQAKNPIREISEFLVTRTDKLITIDVTANGFLHHMVRNLVGVLISIGKNEHPPEWAREVLLRKDRSCAGVTAPAQGLYLLSVQYDPKYSI